ncbi:MAG: YIP1 family protein [Bacteroidales bacterium]|nr:YIP1 family protein [Bacteroidales bacterium]
MSNENIDISTLLNESWETLLNPKDYFLSMPLKGGFAEPVLKAAMYGTVAGLFSLLWTLLGLSVLGGTMWSGALGIMTLISSIIGAIIAAFLGGAIMLLISAMCGGNTDYETNVRTAASLMVIYPINAFMAFLYGINTDIGSIVGLAISFYSLYLLYHAVILSLKGNESSAKIVAIVLVLLTLLGFFGGRKASQSVQDFSKIYEEEQVD